jgi:hypothetical protein
VTPDEFRELALALPEAEERSHMQHPDFRVGGKIFATLLPDGETAMVKLNLEQQAEFADLDPDVFRAIPGGWGRNGATKVDLAPAKRDPVRRALTAAWRNTAPKKLAAKHPKL